MRRLRVPGLVALVLLAGGFGWWQFATRYTPEGQPPLTTLDAASVAAFKEEFNRSSGDTRVILLLSPT